MLQQAEILVKTIEVYWILLASDIAAERLIVQEDTIIDFLSSCRSVCQLQINCCEINGTQGT